MAYAVLTHTQKDAAISPITTSAIDTTGATLLIATVALGQTTFAFTDSQNNRWIQCYPMITQGAQANTILACFNPITSAAHTFTLSAGNFPSIAVSGFSGPLGATFTQVQVANAASPITYPSVTPSNNGALWLAGFCGPNNAALSIDSGFTLIENAGGTNGQKVGLAYLVQSTAAALAPTWTYGSANMAATELVILPSSSGGGTLAAVF